jgi:hypothetical protein
MSGKVDQLPPALAVVSTGPHNLMTAIERILADADRRARQLQEG